MAAGVHGGNLAGREATRSSFVYAGGLLKCEVDFESEIRCWIVEKQSMHC